MKRHCCIKYCFRRIFHFRLCRHHIIKLERDLEKEDSNSMSNLLDIDTHLSEVSVPNWQVHSNQVLLYRNPKKESNKMTQALPVVVMDDEFFEFLDDETDYMGGGIDIGLFGIYVAAWEKSLARGD